MGKTGANTGARSRARRLLRASALFLLAGVALLALGLATLHTPPGRALARGLVEAWGSQLAGGTLRLGRLELALWRGEAAATALSLALPGARIEVQRVEADWAPASGLSLTLVRPSVRVGAAARKQAAPPPASGLAAQPWRLLERLGRVEVVDGRVELRDAADEAWLLLGDLDLVSEPGRSVELRVDDARLGPGSLLPEAARVEAALALEDGALRVEHARLAAKGAAVELTGRLQRILPVSASGSASATLDAARVGALAGRTDVAGRLEASAGVEIAADRVIGTLELEGSELTFLGLGPWSAEARGRFDAAQLRLDSAVARAALGRIEAAGVLGLAPGAPTELSLSLVGLDPAALSLGLSGEPVPLSARVNGSLRWATRGFDLAGSRGSAELVMTARDGPGLRASGRASVRTHGLALTIERASVEARGARATAEAEIAADRSLRGRWSAQLALPALHELLAEVGLKPTAAPLDGLLHAAGELAGPASAPQVSARLHGEGMALRGRPLGLDAELQYQAGAIALRSLVLRSGSGQASLRGTLPVAPGAEWDVVGEIEALGLAPALALAGLAGDGDLTGSLQVTGARDEPIGRLSLRALARLQRPGATASESDPLVLGLEAATTGRRLSVERLEAELAGGRIHGSFGYEPDAGRLEARLELAGLGWQRLPLLPAAARRLEGTLAGGLRLAGSTAAPVGELSLTLSDATLDSAALPPLLATARSDGRELEVEAAAPARFLRGRGPLAGNWPLRIEIDAAALPVQVLLDALPAAKQAGATLAASGTLEVELPLREPLRVRYATSDLSASGRIRRLDWQLAPVALRGDRQSVEIDRLRLSAADAWLSLGGRAALAPGASFGLSVESHLDFRALDPVLPGRNLDGAGELKLRVAGPFEAAELDGTLGLAGMRGRVEGARFRDLELEARFRGRELAVDRLEAKLLGGGVRASGALPILGQGALDAARLVFELHDVDLARALDQETLEAADSPSLVVSASGELVASRLALEAIRVDGQLTRLESKTSEGALALEAPARFAFAAGRFELQPLRLVGPPGSLAAHAVGTQLLGERPRWDASLAGAVDLRALSPFLPGVSLSGASRIDARLSHGDGLRLDGSVRLDDARLALDALNFAASQLTGELRFEGDRMRLEATGAVGDGSLKASGGMRLGASLLGPADLRIDAERVPILYPPGFRGRASGELRLVGEPGRYRVEGEIGVRQAYYTAELDARSQSLDRLDWQLAALDGGSVTDRLALDVKLRLEEPLRIRNSRLRLDLQGALGAAGTLAQPVATGQIALFEGSELTIGRARVRVTQGRVELNGYPAGTPTVDLEGVTRVSGIAIDLRARGSLDDLDISLASDRSDLSQTDLVTLVMTGRTASAAASQGGVVVAEELASALGGVLQKGVGDALLIDVSPDRSLLTDDTDPTQRFNIGHRITQNSTVVYSAALDGTEQRWIVELNPGGGRFRFRAISEGDASYSLEATDRFAFDVWSRRRGAGRAAKEAERLAALLLEGALPLSEPELRGAAGLKPGRRYSGLQREEAADRVRALLVERGWRSASVDANSRPAANGGVELRLRVDAGPLVPLAWTGDDAGGKTREKAERAWSAFATPEAAAAAVARAARFRLQAERYYSASVEPKLRSAQGRVDVTLHVTRGPRGSGVDVDFSGNTVLSDAALLASLPKPGSEAFFEALDPRSSRIANDVRLAYAGVGHLRARAGAPRQAFDRASGRLAVEIPVREGRRSRVAAIALPPELAAEGARAPALRLRTGQAFDLAAYVADRDAIGAWYRREGWLDASVGATLETRGPDVSLRYQVDAGVRPTVGAVRIEQSGNTRESLVRRSLVVREGDVVRPQALAESRERLSEIGVYRSVEVRAEPRAAQDALRDVVVTLQDKPDVTVEYGLRYTTSGEGGAAEAPSSPSGGRLQVAGALELSNPLGLGARVRGYGFVTTQRQTWGVNLDAATLLGRRIRTQLFVYDDSDDEIQVAGLASRVRGFTVQQTRALLRDRRSARWHDRLRLQWGYTLKDIEYFEAEDASMFVRGQRGFASLSLIGDERDSFTDPSRGLFWTATTELARTGLGSDVDYNRFYGQLFGYLPLGPFVWAQGYRLGSVPGSDPFLLIENRFRAGGPTTVRGFEQSGLGPRTAEGDSLGGQAVVVLNQELRFPIWKSVKGGLFWDAGNVWLTADQLDLGDLRQSVGAGLRYMFPFGPIRLEYAWVLNPRPGEAKGRFVFGLGHAF